MKIIKNPLLWIFLFALILRIYKLGEFPVGFHIDEVNAGWNALSILETGKDDHLNFLPLYYNSFGDYRLTGIFYITIPSILLFGRSIFATRFATSLIGSLMIIPVYLLINSLDQKQKIKVGILNLGHISAFLLAISPWEIELSRSTNEALVSTFFTLLAIYLFIKFIENERKIYLLYFSLAVASSYLLYASARTVTPIILIAASLFFIKRIRKMKNPKLVTFPIVIPILFTIVLASSSSGLARFNEVSIFTNKDITFEIQRIKNEDITDNTITKLFSKTLDNQLITYSKNFISQYSQYFSGEFLIGTSAKPYRFATPGTGLITYCEFILLIIGLIQITRKKNSYLPLIFLAIAPIPAALTSEDIPNMSRAFLMSPFLTMVEAFGFFFIIQIFKRNATKALYTICALLLINLSYFEWMYFQHSYNHRPYLIDYASDSPTYRDVGATELAKELDPLAGKYDRVIITNFPDSLYPWYAFLSNKDPAFINQTYQKTSNERDYGNIVFSETKCPTDYAFDKYKEKNILVIDPWECDYQSQIKDGLKAKVVNKILRKDGSEVYILLARS